MLHVHQPTGDVYVVATNELKPAVLTVIKISQQGSRDPSHATLDIDVAARGLPTPTITSSKRTRVTGVAPTQQGELWITGQTSTAANLAEGTFLIQVCMQSNEASSSHSTTGFPGFEALVHCSNCCRLMQVARVARESLGWACAVTDVH
jgi:hypothetical protein